MTKQAKTASSGARGPRGSYAKTAEVRQKILDACVEAFGAGGLHGAIMKEIAERARISQTGLLHHFDSKAELLVEVLAAHERETAATVREADDLEASTSPARIEDTGDTPAEGRRSLRPGVTGLRARAPARPGSGSSSATSVRLVHRPSRSLDSR
ncbi:helix-turn-helix domain-containing protein [Streptomyces sp. NPDC006617]|uniref:TetR/AcrR family transcriptional regulator n=1 Tax=Streptomyces sp. NPDC006617 TaxID=3155354 RepID=UPI0033A3B79E